MKAIKRKVTSLLQHHPNLRDCNTTLALAYYKTYHNVSEHTPFCEVVKMIKDNILPKQSTIERASRQVQEQNPELRTSNWYERKKMEIPFKEQLGYSHSNYNLFTQQNPSLKK